MLRFCVGLLVLPLAASGQSADQCLNLKRVPMADVAISESVIVPSTPTMPGHCLLQGMIDQRVGVGGRIFGMHFELRLPANWEGRFLFQGGGGMDGIVRPAYGPASGADPNPALARGFAVVSTDAGHEGSPADPSFSRDQQARIDNAYRSIERVTAVAKLIVATYYRRLWQHAYFDGCSNGGRQGLIAMQRYPLLFDGIVAGAPAFRVTRAAIDSAWDTILLTRIAPKDAKGKPILSKAFSDSDLKLLANSVLEKCDALDGTKDGLVFNTEACHYDPTPLTCKAAKTDSCLSSVQVDALHRMMTGPVNSQGQSLYSDWPYDPGMAAPGWRLLKLGSSTTPAPDAANVTLMLQGLKGYFMTPYDPDFDPMQFNFDKDPRKVIETATLQDAEMTEVSSFVAHGGKLLLYHGVADPFFSSRDTQRYYERLVQDNGGAERAGNWARLFLVPGMNHCGGGPSLDNFDALEAMVQWVEHAQPPAQIRASGKAFPGVSRPLCAFPKIPRYKGTGPLDDAANFACR